ncbi:MAG: MBL fold metallo-hydrolase [Halobacteriales archaeon]
MDELEPEALAERLDTGDPPLVLDVRHRDSYEAWHIPGSQNLDVYDELKHDHDEAAEKLEPLPEDEVVTVCGVGEVAGDATEVLVELGYDASTLKDGMKGWSRVHRSAEVDVEVDGHLIQVARPGTGCLSHVVVSDGEAAVFDPSMYLDEYAAVVDSYGASVVAVLDSHAHADHVSGGPALAEQHGAPYHLHPDDDLGLDATHVEDGDTVDVGDVSVEVVHTPGHSPGSVCYAVGDDALLTGDTLFHESVGRVELGVDAGIEDVDVEDNAASLYTSLHRLEDRPGDPVVLPAHHPGSPEPPEALRINEVVDRNPAMRWSRDEFVATLSDDVPEQPPNFERIKRVNAGAETLGGNEDFEDLEMGPNNCAAG